MGFYPGKFAAIKIDTDGDDLYKDSGVDVSGTVNFIQHSIYRPGLVDITPLNSEDFKGAVMPARQRILVRGMTDEDVNPGYMNRLPVEVTYWPNLSNINNWRKFSAWLMKLDSIAPSDGPGMFEAILESNGATVTFNWT